MPTKKINRFCYYITATAFDSEAEYPKGNNTFRYHRAPEGYLFQLDHAQISTTSEGGLNGVIEISDGHYYTGWNIFPGVENRETLYRGDMNSYMCNLDAYFHGWECKEFTTAIRSKNSELPFKVCVIMWFYLKKATREELLEYALKHPLREHTFKALLGQYSTVNPEEL